MSNIKVGEMRSRKSNKTPVANYTTDCYRTLSGDSNNPFAEVYSHGLENVDNSCTGAAKEFLELNKAQKFVNDVLNNHKDRFSRIEAIAWRLANEVKNDNDSVVNLYLAEHLLRLITGNTDDTSDLVTEPTLEVGVPGIAPGDDPVHSPKHYTSHPSGIEAIEITRHYNFAVGNAIKYLWRAGLKDENTTIQDLEKAKWYIDDEIKRLTTTSKV